MKIKDFNNLRPSDRIEHKHYGHCAVQKFIPDFGPVIQPLTHEGKMKLYHHSAYKGGRYGMPLLENSYRMCQPSAAPYLPIQTCRICGCTDLDCTMCIAITGHPCHWVAPDLCSRCAPNSPIS
ncbi:MAG: hypothetical protein K9J37_19695 [Saprospiraceae bacterium]|nr:hypothetical protein [Saprospiraceae bacterium]MCF8252150.1 hypothetical protein [Saprospiraceae bacterium]MCF8282441.1 hypothetical protein [Bacteroidales bacterium]MCF8313819.1 hypothetical protein [Saprospiraceae bacterium]MCF8442525.1 hypothetical protein [Saprospiraceae bacterium]